MGKPLRIGKGKPGPGRPKGTPNKITANAKEAFAAAFEGMGGIDRLMEWAEENPTDFFKLYARLIPIDVTTGGEKITVTINVPPLPNGGPER